MGAYEMSVFQSTIDLVQQYQERRIAWKRQKHELHQQRDMDRGYSLNLKYIGIAFAAEAMVIVTSLVGAYLFAKQYSGGNADYFSMMLLAPISYAIIEMTRVPLAIACRTQRSFIIRLLAVLGVLAAAGVTIKSMSQLGEIMFRPRLIEVTKANHNLLEATALRDGYLERKKIAEAEVARLTDEKLKAGEANTQQALNLKNVPKPICSWRTWRNRDGSTGRRQVCTTPPAAAAMVASSNESTETLKAASAKLDEANTRLIALGSSAELDKAVTDAEKKYKDAVLNSQLHAFTGMLFAKDPASVTEKEISEFLRLFVFIPAICVSLASTLLAMAAVTRMKPKKDTAAANTVELNNAASAYVLEPVAQHILNEATAAARKEVEQTLEKVRPIRPEAPKVA